MRFLFRDFSWPSISIWKKVCQSCRSSQFFFFLYEAELNPAGRNLIDGRNAAFGYVVDGFEVLEDLTKDDIIMSIDVIEGIENLKLNA